MRIKGITTYEMFWLTFYLTGLFSIYLAPAVIQLFKSFIVTLLTSSTYDHGTFDLEWFAVLNHFTC